MKLLFSGLALAALMFALGSVGYLAISSVLGGAFAGLFRMFMYHEQHPYQYIALVAIVFGFFGAWWQANFRKSAGWIRWSSILATIICTVMISSIPGGILWKLHDMQAGYFPTGTVFWSDLCWGATEGLLVGWLVMLLSIPYNICGVVVGALVLDGFGRIMDSTNRPRIVQERSAGPSPPYDP